MNTIISRRECLISSDHHECLNRKNKSLLCCIDDINEEIELITPVLDKIQDSISLNSISKETFSKTMYVADILNSQTACDNKVVSEIKRISYFLYSAEVSDTWTVLSTSLLKEIFKWFKSKTSGISTHLEDCEIYLLSLTADIETILSLLNGKDEAVECDDIFF